jgi:large subunit ribosomal protein L5
MANIPNFQKKYFEEVAPALKEKFQYTSTMEIPRIEKIVINQGIGEAITDKKLIQSAIDELTLITGQRAVSTMSKRDISNFKLRKDMPIGVRVTLRRQRMYEFLERLVRASLPRIRDFNGVPFKLDGRGNYTLGITEQIIFPEIQFDQVDKLMGMNITFVTSAKTDEEGYALLKEFGFPFKNNKKS